MHVFVSFPLDEPIAEEALLSNIRKGLGSLGKDCDLLSLPVVESESIDCLFEAEESVLALERLTEDIICKYMASYAEISSGSLTDSVVLGKSFDHFLKSFRWNSGKYPLSSKISDILASMQEEAACAMDALKEKEKAYSEEKRLQEHSQHREDGRMSEVNIEELEYAEKDGMCAPFFKKYYIGAYEKLREKDVEVLSKIDGLFIESRNLVKKCTDGELYEAMGKKDTEEEIAEKIEKSGFMVRKPQLSKEEYLAQIEKQEEIAAQLKEIEQSFERMILGRLPWLYSLLLHVKHLGLYVDSILRYGPPPVFCVFITECKSEHKLMQKWRKISASWKYSKRMAGAKKPATPKDGESTYDFVYKMVGRFDLESNRE